MNQNKQARQAPSHSDDSDYWDNGTILFEGYNELYNYLDRFTAHELHVLYLANYLPDDDPEKAKAVAEWKRIETRRRPKKRRAVLS